MKNRLIEGVIILFLLCSIGFTYHYYENRIQEIQTELVISEQNYKAETDSLRSNLKTKEGDIVYMKHMYATNINDLNSKLNELRENNKKLNFQIKQLIETNAQIKQDSLIAKTDTIIIKDSISSIYFNYKDKWTSFNGVTYYDNINNYNTFTQLTNLSINAPLTVGISKDNQVMITSDNPNLIITDIKGVTTFEKKKKRKFEFTHGLQLGFGLQYGIVNNKIDIGPSFNYGIGIKF